MDAERHVKVHQAQYDRSKGKPVTQKDPKQTTYYHEPGADVVRQPTDNEAPQYVSDPTPQQFVRNDHIAGGSDESEVTMLE